MTENTPTTDGNKNIYELGFLLVPALNDDKVDEAVEDIKELIADHDGEVLEEGKPEYRELAYEMEHVTGDEKRDYQNAHFGWIQFNAPGPEADALQDELAEDDRVIRFLCISIDEERVGQPEEENDDEVEDADDSGEEDEDMDEEEVDEAIDELVVE